MQSKKALSKKVEELLAQLDDAMSEKHYGEVDEILTIHPGLIHDATASCEVPLVMAIKHWDLNAVRICIKHGANPDERHLCSKDNNNPKIPKLILAEEFIRRIGKNPSPQKYHAIDRVYSQICTELMSVSPIKKKGE